MENVLYVPTRKFVSFSETGEITSIGNSKPDDNNFLVVDYSNISKILSGEESPASYEVKFDNQSKGYKLFKKIEEKTEAFNFNENFYEFIHNKFEYDIKIIQNNMRETWEIIVEQDLADVLLGSSMYKDTKIFFSITEKDNPFVLHQFIVLDFYNLLNEKKLVESFNKNITTSKIYSIYTKKVFEHYSYEVINE